MCRIANVFLLQRLKGSMSGDARVFNNIETRAVIKFFLSARQGAEGNSRHSALAIQKKLANLGFQCLYHPPYSPDLAPSDCRLFPGLKKTIESSPFFV